MFATLNIFKQNSQKCADARIYYNLTFTKKYIGTARHSMVFMEIVYQKSISSVCKQNSVDVFS
jgi:hypothetical protein